METPTKLLGLIGGGLVTLGTVYTIVTFTHDKIQQVDEQGVDIGAIKEEIKQVRGNVVIDEIKAEMRWLQRRVFRIEEIYGDDMKTAPAVVREEYKQNKVELEALQQELKTTQRVYKSLR